MKSKNLLFIFALLSVSYICMSNAGGAPSGWTGAPLEGTCSTNGGCHNGGSFTGGVTTITGLPATVEANKDYVVTVNCTVAKATTSGFEITSLDDSGMKSGNWTAAAAQKLGSINTPSRQYVTQSAPQKFVNGAVKYVCNWKSPATSSSKNITFYAAVLAANGNGAISGDVAFSASQKVLFPTVTTNDLALQSAMTIFPNPVTNTLNINILNFENVDFKLFNEYGQVVLFSQLNEKNTIDVSNLARGIYFAKIEKEGKQAVKMLVLEY
jgi:hypothetical protein